MSNTRTSSSPTRAARPPHWRGRHLLAAVSIVWASTASAQDLPPPLTNYYNLAAGKQAVLSSYVTVEDKVQYIGYSILTPSVDRYVQVVWNDAQGRPLIGGDNAYWGNVFNPKDFGGYIDATEWRRGALLGAPAPKQAVGTADFTGTSPGDDPCGVGYVCNNAKYYYWPSFWGTQNVVDEALRATAANTPVVLGTLTGTLSIVGVDPNDPSDVGDRRAQFIEFNSTVEFDTDHYLYRYSVTNFSDLTIPFDWAAGGLSGDLDPFAVAQHEFASTLAPGVQDSLPSWTLRTDSSFPVVVNFANSLNVYAPVPEAATWSTFSAGLLALGFVARRRRRSGADG